MKSFGLSRYALIGGVAVALLAGCGGLRPVQDDMQPPFAASGASPQSMVSSTSRRGAARVLSVSFQVLHRFGHHAYARQNREGAVPDAGLIDVDGTLYGTAMEGGHRDSSGVFYSITTTGMEDVRYRFRGHASDGSQPTDDLTDLNGTLYGTAFQGGTCGAGILYSLSTTGAEKVLHSFCPGSDGSPMGGVINVNGTLYGTFVGGNSSGGVYSISPSGGYNALYTFGGSGDGGWPVGHLLDVNGALYGTTTHGGAACFSNGGCGTVFRVTTSGKEKVLYSFQGGTDGNIPAAGLINVNGTLYGTTKYGGSSGCGFGCGTAFSISTSGTENVLYRFTGGADGGAPIASLLELNGRLYGTTSVGGTYGMGTVFSMSTSGDEQVLHSFGGADGADPEADLLDVNGTLYGTTKAGGSKQGCGGGGCGTIFALTP